MSFSAHKCVIHTLLAVQSACATRIHRDFNENKTMYKIYKDVQAEAPSKI